MQDAHINKIPQEPKDRELAFPWIRSKETVLKNRQVPAVQITYVRLFQVRAVPVVVAVPGHGLGEVLAEALVVEVPECAEPVAGLAVGFVKDDSEQGWVLITGVGFDAEVDSVGGDGHLAAVWFGI